MKKVLLLLILVLPLLYAYNRYGYLIQSARNFPSTDKNVGGDPISFPQNGSANESDPSLSYLKVPPGFAVTYFADSVPGARSLAIGRNGIV